LSSFVQADESEPVLGKYYSRVGLGTAQTDMPLYTTGWSLDLAAGGLFAPDKALVPEVAISYVNPKRTGTPNGDFLTTIGLSGLYKFNTSPTVDVYGRIGVHAWIWGNFLEAAGGFSSRKTGVGLTYGLGVQTRLDAHNGVRLEWQTYANAVDAQFSKIMISWVGYP
jgi:hypothetical protein